MTELNWTNGILQKQIEPLNGKIDSLEKQPSELENQISCKMQQKVICYEVKLTFKKIRSVTLIQ